MSKLKKNILIVIKAAYTIGKENQFQGTILTKEKDCRKFITDAYVQYKNLKCSSNEIKILRLYCRYALEDCKDSIYSINIKNLLNEFHEIFSTRGIKKLSRVISNC